jgi:hypothetical protein
LLTRFALAGSFVVGAPTFGLALRIRGRRRVPKYAATALFISTRVHLYTAKSVGSFCELFMTFVAVAAQRVTMSKVSVESLFGDMCF